MVAGGSLYWIGTDEIVHACVLDYACAAEDVRDLASGQTGGRALAADSDNVYWATSDLNGGEIRAAKQSALVDGGAETGAPMTLATGQDGPIALAVEGPDLYWLTKDALVRGRTTRASPTVLVTGLSSPKGLVVLGPSVYVTEADNGRVLKIAK